MWFISAESATRCLDHAAHHDIVVDEHLIVYERLNTHLSKSPPKPSILTAPERKISNTIYVDGCSMSLSVVKNDFGKHGEHAPRVFPGLTTDDQERLSIVNVYSPAQFA